MRSKHYQIMFCLLGPCSLLAMLVGADDGNKGPAVQPGNSTPAVRSSGSKGSTGKSEATKTTAVTAEEHAVKEKFQPLNKQGTVLLDTEGHRLLLKGSVCLRRGALELLCCLKQTKEHEAIVSVDTKAYVVHAGLLALGVEQGKPAEFDPEFKPPTGQRIDVFVVWKDEKGKTQRVAAQEWIRFVTSRFYSETLEKLPVDAKLSERLDEMRYDAKQKELIWYGPMTEETKKKFLAMSKDPAFQKCINKIYERTQPKQMKAHWVFSGSGFYEDEQTKEKYYRAEDGDLICVANFSSATLDIETRSSNGADDLMFEAWTERIPEVGTPVTIELIPVTAKEATSNNPAPKSAPSVKSPGTQSRSK